MAVKQRARNEWQKEARRKTIIKAADVLFQKNGGRLSSIQSVAKHAGVAKGTMYLYFRNKDELYMAVLEHRARLWIKAIIQALESYRSPLTIADVVDAISGHVLENPEVLILTTLSSSVIDYEVEREEEMRFRTAMATMAAQVGAAIEQGMPGLAPGQGTALFMRSLAYILGAWQIIQPSSVMDEISRREELSPFRLEFGNELRAGLTALWTGALRMKGGS